MSNQANLDQCVSIFFQLTQIKFDVTGDAVSPELWYKMKINDYHKNKTKIKIANNEIVSELHLNKNFKI